MTIDADADIGMLPRRLEMIGVIGVNDEVTRTETTLPGFRLAHVAAVQFPVGEPPLGSHRV